MPITLTEGLSDTSKELGETTTNTTARRIQHFNDAVIDFANERKWPFLVKESTAMTTLADTQSYAIHANILADIRLPGGIKEITIGDSTVAIKPINWEDRGDSRFSGGNWFYMNEEQTTFYFNGEITTAGETIHVHYYYIPARTEDVDAGTFPLPDRYRKALGLLSASNVQFSRYLEAQGNRLFNMYVKQVRSITQQQSEQPTHRPRSLPHYLAWRGQRFRTTRYS